jgi:hypothetical protein
LVLISILIINPSTCFTNIDERLKTRNHPTCAADKRTGYVYRRSAFIYSACPNCHTTKFPSCQLSQSSAVTTLDAVRLAKKHNHDNISKDIKANGRLLQSHASPLESHLAEVIGTNHQQCTVLLPPHVFQCGGGGEVFQGTTNSSSS